MKEIKRPPLLIDSFLASKQDLSPMTDEYKKLYHLMKDKLLTAKRYVFDDQATRYLGEMINDLPAAIAYAQEFAIPPYPSMWVEMNCRTLLKTINHDTTSFIDAPSSDFMIGYYFLGPNVYTFVKSEEGWTMMNVFYYKLNQPMTFEDEQKFCRTFGASRMQIDFFFWGSTALNFLSREGEKLEREPMKDGFKIHMPEGDLDEDEDQDHVIIQETGTYVDRRDSAITDKVALRMLRMNHGFEAMLPPSWEHRPDRDTKLSQIMSGNAGDLRNIIAILLLLNRSSKITYTTDVEPQRRMYMGKARTFLSHQVISFKLNPVPTIRSLLAEAGENWRRRHDVRGHFCLSKQARDAENHKCLGGLHDWVEDKGPHLSDHYWKCKNCAGAKWWRKAHGRGRLESGIGTADYQVTAQVK